MCPTSFSLSNPSDKLKFVGQKSLLAREHLRQNVTAAEGLHGSYLMNYQGLARHQGPAICWHIHCLTESKRYRPKLCSLDRRGQIDNCRRPGLF